MAETGIAAAKRTQRARMLAARDALLADARERLCAAITDKLVVLPEFLAARTVAGYASFGSEFDTAAFNAAVLAGGKRLILPRIDRPRRVMMFHAVTDLQESLVAGVWGIREPDPLVCPRADLDDVDMMLVPGLAFTTRCERLGYGGGFYDAAIEMTRPQANKVAAAFSMQIVETLVIEPHDRIVDLLVTEDASYSSGPGGSGQALSLP
jgi:5-formyltetrahydrofolate cyclo-ligase